MSKYRLALVSVVLVLLACGAMRGGAILEQTEEQTYTVGANPALSVRNTDGRIYVYGSEDNEIKVKIYKRAFTKERLEKIAAHISLEGDAMTIETSYPPAPKGLFEDRSGTVEYTILVPQNCVVSNLELSQGEISVQGLRGAGVDVCLTNGRMNVKNCFTPMRLTLGSGGIDVSFDWWENAAFALTAEIGKGDFGLRFPPTAAFQLDAATNNGHVRNYLQDDAEHADDVQEMRTAIGGGSDVQFKIRTNDGNVRIGKAY
jgi:hypothetical protein